MQRNTLTRFPYKLHLQIGALVQTIRIIIQQFYGELIHTNEYFLSLTIFIFFLHCRKLLHLKSNDEIVAATTNMQNSLP